MRLRGIDTIRFFCAFIVAAVHCGFIQLLFSTLGLPTSMLDPVILGAFAQAPVAVFFVISGLCIYFPYRNGRVPDPLPYALRRQLRILPPCIMTIVLAASIGISMFPLDKTNMWSIVCEEIYYAIFPFVTLLLVRRAPWWVLIVLAHAVSMAIALLQIQWHQLDGYANWLNWLGWYPAFLWGCHLAGRADALLSEQNCPSLTALWTWRSLIIAYASGVGILYARSTIVGTILILAFSPIIYLWLAKEIAGYGKRPPLKVFEWAGGWSYSLYLVHLPVAVLSLLFVPPSLPPALQLLYRLVTVLFGCYVFYLAVEFPSHKLSRRIKNIYKVSPDHPI